MNADVAALDAFHNFQVKNAVAELETGRYYCEREAGQGK